MATPYSIVYDLFLNETDSSDLVLLSDDLYYMRLFLFLKVSISVFSRRCYEDISSSNRTDFARDVRNETITSPTNTIVLSPVPTITENIYIEVNGQEVTNYTFDGIDTITFTTNLNTNDEVRIALFTIGEFNADLNDTEQDILKYVMQFAFDNFKKQRREFLELQVHGSDFKVQNAANHLDKMVGLTQNQYERYDARIREYTYFHGSNSVFNRLRGVN